MRADLDKPNVHRMIELYQHTLPRFGHMPTVDELPFEAAHQPLKRALSRSNHKDGHVFATKSVLANDWRLRMGDICATLPTSRELSEDHCRQLVGACFGAYTPLDNGQVLIDDVKRAFTPGLRKIFRRYSTKSKRQSHGNAKAVWAVRSKNRIRERRTIGDQAPMSFSARLGFEDSHVRRYILSITAPLCDGSCPEDFPLYEYSSCFTRLVVESSASDSSEYQLN